ncbi:MAG: hypothetical protein SPE59_11855 [Treponema sp.]|nr:hypothetical protein [Treponema sp.]
MIGKWGKIAVKFLAALFSKKITNNETCTEKCEKKCSDYQKHSQNGMKVSLPVCACSELVCGFDNHGMTGSIFLKEDYK